MSIAWLIEGGTGESLLTGFHTATSAIRIAAKSPDHSISRNYPTCARRVRQLVTPEMRLTEWWPVGAPISIGGALFTRRPRSVARLVRRHHATRWVWTYNHDDQIWPWEASPQTEVAPWGLSFTSGEYKNGDYRTTARVRS